MTKCDPVSYDSYGEVKDNWQTVHRVLLGIQTAILLIGLILVYPVNMRSVKPVFLSVCWGLIFFSFFFGCFASMIIQIDDRKWELDREWLESEWYAAAYTFMLLDRVFSMVMHQVLTMEVLQAAQEVPQLSRPADEQQSIESSKKCQWWTRFGINAYFYACVFVFWLLCSIQVDSRLSEQIFWYWSQAFSAIVMIVALIKLKGALERSGVYTPNSLAFTIFIAVQCIFVVTLCLVFAFAVTNDYQDQSWPEVCKMYKAESWMKLLHSISTILCLLALTFISFKSMGELPQYDKQRITKGCMHVVKGFSMPG